MAEEEKDTDAEQPEDQEGEPQKKKLSGKLIVMIAGAAVLVIGLGVGAAFFFGVFGGGDEEHLAEGEHGEASHDEHGDDHGGAAMSEVVFFDLPEMLVNLNTGGRGTTYLKLKVAIELEDEAAIAEIEPLIPRVVDRFQVYLRELRVSDLNGSAGTYHLKAELLRRINAAVPVEVKDVLFKEMIVQ